MARKPKTGNLEKKLGQTTATLKRALADYANLEKRVEAERKVLARLASAQLILKLLPAIDNLETAAGHLKDQGLTMVVEAIHQVFKSEGLEEIAIENGQFDPQIMEAVGTVEGEENKVAELVRKGYKLNGQVIRPAQVKVGKAAKGEAEEKAEKASGFGDYA